MNAIPLTGYKFLMFDKIIQGEHTQNMILAKHWNIYIYIGA